MAAAALPPVDYYTFFLKSLLETVRINIGECAAASYSVLTVEAATKLFMFTNEKVTLAYLNFYAQTRTTYPPLIWILTYFV